MTKVEKVMTTQVYRLQEGNRATHFESIYDLATYLKHQGTGTLGYIEKFNLYSTKVVECAEIDDIN